MGEDNTSSPLEGDTEPRPVYQGVEDGEIVDDLPLDSSPLTESPESDRVGRLSYLTNGRRLSGLMRGSSTGETIPRNDGLKSISEVGGLLQHLEKDEVELAVEFIKEDLIEVRNDVVSDGDIEETTKLNKMTNGTETSEQIEQNKSSPSQSKRKSIDIETGTQANGSTEHNSTTSNSVLSTRPKRKTRQSPPKPAAKEADQSNDSQTKEGAEDRNMGSDNELSPDPSVVSDRVSKYGGNEELAKQAQKDAVAMVKKLEIEFTKLKVQIYHEKLGELTQDVQSIQDGTSPLLHSRTAEAKKRRLAKLRQASKLRKYALWEASAQLANQQYGIDTQFLSDRKALKQRLHDKILKEKWKVQEAKILSDMAIVEGPTDMKLSNKELVDSLPPQYSILSQLNSDFKAEPELSLQPSLAGLLAQEISEDINKIRQERGRFTTSPGPESASSGFDLESLMLAIRKKRMALKQPKQKRNGGTWPKKSTYPKKESTHPYNVNDIRAVRAQVALPDPTTFQPHAIVYNPPKPIVMPIQPMPPAAILPLPPANTLLPTISPFIHAQSATARVDIKVEANLLSVGSIAHRVGDRVMVQDNLQAASFPARLAGLGKNEITLQKFDGAKTKIPLPSLANLRYQLTSLPAEP